MLLVLYYKLLFKQIIRLLLVSEINIQQDNVPANQLFVLLQQIIDETTKQNNSLMYMYE